MANKVQYGLSNLYYAIATEDETGKLTYEAPKRWPGAVSLSLDQQGDTTNEYADNGIWYAVSANNGYQGTLEVEPIPDSILTDLFGVEKSTNGIVAEYSNAKQTQFALLGQFEGDESPKRFVLYNCIASRPSLSGSTTTESTEFAHDSVTITAMPRINDQLVKGSVQNTEETASIYSSWFTAVQEPTAEEETPANEGE